MINGALTIAMASVMREVSVKNEKDKFTGNVVRINMVPTADGLHVRFLSCIGSDTTKVEVPVYRDDPQKNV